MTVLESFGLGDILVFGGELEQDSRGLNRFKRVDYYFTFN